MRLLKLLLMGIELMGKCYGGGRLSVMVWLLVVGCLLGKKMLSRTLLLCGLFCLCDGLVDAFTLLG